MAYNSVVQIFSRGTHAIDSWVYKLIMGIPETLLSGEVTWGRFDGFSPNNSNGGLVTAMHFVQHPSWSLIVTHAQSGIT